MSTDAVRLESAMSEHPFSDYSAQVLDFDQFPKSLVMYNLGVKKQRDQKLAIDYYQQRQQEAEEKGERAPEGGHTLDFYLNKYKAQSKDLIERNLKHN